MPTPEVLMSFSKQFEGDFHLQTLHRLLYATDASVYRKKPLAVAYPKNEKGIQQLVRFAEKHRIGLIPRAAGTSLAGQCVGNGIVVDISKYFTKIVGVDTENRTVTVQPGVIRDELNEYLKPYGLFFGPNTSTSNRCMIGGMIGNNSSGTTSIQYGVTRDKVVSLKTILSNGEMIQFEPLSKSAFIEKASEKSFEGSLYNLLYTELSKSEVQHEIRKEFPKPEIHRRNTGYAVDALLNTSAYDDTCDVPINLSSLLCGSEGTLAFTTEITLQLDPLPPEYSAMVVSQYENLSNCLNDVVVAMQHNLFTCEMMDDVILGCTEKNKKYEPYRFFVEGTPKALLMLELRDETVEGLKSQTEKLLKALEISNLSYARPVLKGEEIEMALDLRKAGLGLLGNMVGDAKAVACIEDTAVALADLPKYIEEFTLLMKNYGQEAVYYAHAGAGELHLRPILNLKKGEGVDYFRKITTDVSKLCKKYKGSFSGEHGDGIVRAEFLEQQIGEKNFQLLKRIKQAFDPQNIFNPGKITDAWQMDVSLRYESNRKEPEIDTLLDFSDAQGLLRLAENCNGSGDCRKTEKSAGAMCPSYHATRDEKHTTRGRANVLREFLTHSDKQNAFDHEELKEVFDLCISCKACGNECPSNVDMATAKAEFQYQYYTSNKRSRRDKRFGKSSSLYKKAKPFANLANAALKIPFIASLVKNTMGMAAERSIPKFQPFQHSTSTSISTSSSNSPSPSPNKKKVILFIDEFSNYLDGTIAEDAVFLLQALGYEVEPTTGLDSGRALISKGFLEEAKECVNKNITLLNQKVSAETPLLGIEPSAILGFRDEYLRLADDAEAAKGISKNCFLVEEFLASEMKLGVISTERFTSEEKKIKIHVHCHQKSLSNQKVTFDILNFPKNFKPTIIPSGCCGMAGSFGYEKEHYDISMKMGELKLFPAVRNASADTIIAANGTSCRHQIKDGTSKEALHPITILRNALVIPQ
ncbi:FAD-binding protein [Flavobacteriaceae bacterium TK19130]|nr:FAD-binding protein [Thermobacterium salinum]